MSYELELKSEGFKDIVSQETEKEICLFFANSNLDDNKRKELIELFKKINLDSLKNK